MELTKKTKMLEDQQKMMVEMTAKVMEEVAKERTELTSKHYEEMERARKVFNRVQMTYQTKLIRYEVQAMATANLIKQLKDEKHATNDITKLGIE